MEKKKVRILSYHPFSLYSTGGGSRILRRFYEEHESEILCLVPQQTVDPIVEGKITQVSVKQFPLHRPWFRSYLRTATIWLRNVGLKSVVASKIKAAARNINYDILHIVNHGPLSATLCSEITTHKKELWVSFHDYFSTSGSSYEDASKLWNLATRRFVISQEMGVEYCRLFGTASFEVFTDGVYKEEMSQPPKSSVNKDTISIYFAGLLHLEYLPLFKVLADAIDLLVAQGFKIELILRGTQNVDFLNNRSFKTVYKPITLDSEELKAELDSASILYLPIKFTDPLFHLYSMSTKMVGYLGAAGAILYHGPEDSAAAKLLKGGNAAMSCYNFDKHNLSDCIKNLTINNRKVVENAKRLAEEKFDLISMRESFWK